ncbi:EAL domain-containing protein [Neptunicella sp. SCSIO 80796]|uniref:EAL domain-containing protein n=1 Tax=Neptunicella plasticusilytica TaxID=3117012 RepID=UPI003A4E0AF5
MFERLTRLSIAFLVILSLVHIVAHAVPVKTTNLVDNSLNVHNLYLQNGSLDDAGYSAVVDKQGFLWIGTDNGLRRYDGYKLKHFTHNPDVPDSLGSSLAEKLLIDHSDVLWVAGKRLSQYHPETESFTVYDVTGFRTIHTLYQDADGLIWLGGDGFGIKAFDPATGKVIRQLFEQQGEARDRSVIQQISPDLDSDYLWIASGAGLYKVNRLTLDFEKFPLPGDMEAGVNSIRDLLMDQQGTLWIATHEGILAMDPVSRQVRRYRAGDVTLGQLSSDSIWTIFQDSAGQIWFGTDKTGIHRYNPAADNFIYYPASNTDKRALPAASVFDIYEDRQGSLWLSFNNFGVRRISPQMEKFSIMQHKDGAQNSLALNNVLDLHEDEQGNIYIATDGQGLDKYNPVSGQYTHFTHDENDANSLSSDSVLAIADDHNGHLWIGTWNGGINIFDKQTGTFSHIQRDASLPENKSLENNNIFRIEPMSDGRMLLSVWASGMQIYDPQSETFESYFPSSIGSESGAKNSMINDFLADGKGNYWVAGNGGLQLFNPVSKTFKSFSNSGLFDIIYDIYPEPSGALWIASSQGFFHFEPDSGKLRSYSVEQGMSDNFAVSIEKDKNGNIWLGTRSGLNKFDPVSETFEIFDNGDGLAGMQFNRYSHLHTRSGEMYFGGTAGISRFNPNHLPRNSYIPDIVFTGLELFQQQVVPGKDALLKQPLNEVRKVVLDYDQRDITFEFAALNFISPNNNKYRYKLEKLENSWTEVDSNRRRVRYTNLDPGNYTFMVVASNNDNVWNDTPATVALTVLRPWWMTWWARIVFILLGLLLLAIFLRWLSRSSERKRLLLSKMVEEKTGELEKANATVLELNAELENRVEKRTAELNVEVNERRVAEAKLFHMAFHDALTGLPNRSWLIQHLEELIEKNRGCQEPTFALMFLDGDKFKQINDSLGHSVGDQVLVEAAQRLEYLLPRQYHAVRLGGDEFTVVVEGRVTDRNVRMLGKSIVNAFETPLEVKGIKVPFRLSVGMVIGGKQYTKPEQILRDADIAMYKAKEMGRGTCQLFDRKMREQTMETIELETDIAQAISKQQMFVVYQPIIDMPSGNLTGFEALLRWQHPDKGFISPDKFIPIAEESGQIIEIGCWVLEQACLQLKQWQDDPEITLPITMSVNISTKQLRGTELIRQVSDILQKTGIPGDLLKLEITESALMENADTVRQTLDALNLLGIEFAIDDFGTGYSSLAYLERLPVQFLKIDRMFIDAITSNQSENGNASEIVRATVSLAHNLNIKVVAEGIETEKQRQLLSQFDCDLGQGFLYAKPLVAESAKLFILGKKDNLATVTPFTKRKIRK